MKVRYQLFCILLLIVFDANAYITVCSWNLKDFGRSKSESELNFIAETVKIYDIVTIQEVVAGPGGAQAVALLADILNRKGNKWDYCISDPTFSSSYKTERYAFLWKTNKVTRVGVPWLEKKFRLEIDREPYFITFKTVEFSFTLSTFHAITKAKQPETEIKYFKLLPEQYKGLNIIFCGDFNLPQSHSVFNPLKSMGYKPILFDQKTTLRQKCINNDCLASMFDNMFYNSSKIIFISSGVLHFYSNFNDFEKAKAISDHLPLYFEFNVKMK